MYETWWWLTAFQTWVVCLGRLFGILLLHTVCSQRLVGSWDAFFGFIAFSIHIFYFLFKATGLARIWVPFLDTQLEVLISGRDACLTKTNHQSWIYKHVKLSCRTVHGERYLFIINLLGWCIADETETGNLKT